MDTLTIKYENKSGFMGLDVLFYKVKWFVIFNIMSFFVKT